MDKEVEKVDLNKAFEEYQRQLKDDKLKKAKIPLGEDTVGDVYELFNKAVQVHTQGMPELSADFTLSNLDDSVSANKSIKFVREQIKVSRIIKNYLKDPKIANKTADILMGDVYVTVIMSRARGGLILNRLLDRDWETLYFY